MDSHLFTLLATAFALGLLHGVTPDEHTWPITLSYAIGSFSGRRGLQAGLLFSAALTTQYAFASLLVYLALAPFLALDVFRAWIDVVVGLVMLVSGIYILRLGRELHFTEGFERWLHRRLHVGPQDGTDGRLTPASSRAPVPLRMTLVHGFVAGWGTDAFALIIYGSLVPAMPNLALAAAPGILFGLGTMLVQVGVGALAGAWMAHRGLTPTAMSYVARSVAGHTLSWGGAMFCALGATMLLVPGANAWLEGGLTTGIALPELDSLSLGWIATIAVVLTVAIVSFVRAARQVHQQGQANLDKRPAS